VKNLLFSIMVAFTMLFAIPLQSQAQGVYGAGINDGYSWLNGVIGAEIFIHKISVSGGWMPTSMPLSEEKVNSYSWAITAYSQPMDLDSWYLSYGMAMSGYREDITHDYRSYDSQIKPMNIIMCGYRFVGGSGNWNLKAGIGAGWCSEMTVFTG